MLSQHAASRAVTTGLRFSSSGSSPSTSKTPYDVRFLRSFIRAALHGHSPSYKRRGWKSPGTKHGRASPYSYLSRDLVDKDLTHTHEKGGARIFEQDGHERPRTFKVDPDRDRRPSSSKSRKGKGRAAIQSRSYATQASETLEDVGSDQESDFGVDNDLEADNVETSPKEASRDVPSAIEKRDRQLKPGDWIQVSLFGDSTGYIYVGEDTSTRSMVRRVLLHSPGNVLISARISDVFYRIRYAVSTQMARDAAWMLELSPPEYLENLEEIDSANLASMKNLSSENSDLFGPTEQKMWESYGLKFGTKEWQKAYKAKMQIGRVLRDIDRQQETFRKEVLGKGIRELHGRLMARSAPTSNITVEEAFQELYGKQANIYKGQERVQRTLAVHNYLFEDSDHYVADPIDYLISGSFRLRRPDELKILTRVRDWIRVDSQEIKAVKQRVQTLRSEIRRKKEAISDSSTSKQAEILEMQSLQLVSATPFTESDLQVIEFLKNSLEMKRQMQVNPYQASVAVLVKSLVEKEPEAIEAAFDVPEFHYTRLQTIQLLKDLGVWQPWENLVLQNPEVGLDAWKESKQSRKATQELQGPDGLDHVRHDFGDLPVYTIDDASASELDDGISIEPCLHSPDSQRRPTHWVHIHVADPTSTLQPKHQLAIQAKKRLSSIYFPEMTWPMLPFDLIEQQGWSLGTGKEGSQGQRVMTFSARLDDDGNILESKVRAGVVNNVNKVTYNMVDELLGEQTLGGPESKERASLVWPTGSQAMSEAPLPEGRLSQLEPSAKGDLAKLRMLSDKLTRSRAQASALAWRGGGSVFQLHPRPLPPFLETPSAPHFFLNNPITRLTLPSTSSTSKEGSSTSVAMEMVAEYMILAGKLAALHLSERGIAGPYRGQDAPIADKGVLDQLLAKRDEAGFLPQSELAKFKLQFQAAYFSASPIDHWPMGIKASEGGYLRATSPLRRYTDLVAHWQIKSSLDTADPNKRPPFSKQDVENMLYQTERTTALRRRSEGRGVQFWKLYIVDKKWREALLDATRDPEAAELLLNGLTAVVREVRADALMLRLVASVNVPELGLTGSLQTSPHMRLTPGERVKVATTGVILDEYSKLYLKLRE